MNSMTLWNKNRTHTHPTYFRDLCRRMVTRLVNVYGDYSILLKLYDQIFLIRRKYFNCVLFCCSFSCLITMFKPCVLNPGYIKPETVKQVVTNPLPSAPQQICVTQKSTWTDVRMGVTRLWTLLVWWSWVALLIRVICCIAVRHSTYQNTEKLCFNQVFEEVISWIVNIKS